MNPEGLKSAIEGHGLARPIVSGESWTFVYDGTADAVEILFMEDRFPPGGQMHRLEGSDIWYFEVSAPADSMIEYKFAVTREGTRRMIADPSNPAAARDPFGSNSVATGPNYIAPSWIDFSGSDCEIVDVEIESEVWGRARRHQLMYPPGYSAGSPIPLLILHDGPDYVDYADLARCISSLSRRELIRPPLIFLHQPGQRHTAYADNPRHVSHIFDEVIPNIGTEHSVDGVFAGGASLGGVASLSLAHRRPGETDGLMLQSGSFIRQLGGKYQRARVLAPAIRLRDEVLENPVGLPERVAVSCGTFDGLVEENRDFVPRLAENVSFLSYGEINAGHHWLCWRDRLEPDLIALFGQN